MMDERFIIKTIDASMWPEIMSLIHDGWNEEHVFTKSESLLKWHYIGFGPFKNRGAFALYDGNTLIGFRLMIPIEMMVSSQSSKQIFPLAVSTLYFIKPEYRGMKLGLKMQFYTIEHFGGYFAIASNLKTSAPIHKKSGAKMLDTMYRYIRPLSSDIKELIVSEIGHHWSFSAPRSMVSPIIIDAESLANAWSSFIERKKLISLNRNKDFWQWRYIDSPIYKYVFFKDDSGVIVGRVSDLFNEDSSLKRDKVFRILELIPASDFVWNRDSDSRLLSFIDGVCGWAKKQGCIAAEFYMTTSRFGQVMKDALFEEVNKAEPLASSIMSYFEPCSMSHRLSNVSILSSFLPDDFSFEDSYFSLADADQDRPNILKNE